MSDSERDSAPAVYDGAAVVVTPPASVLLPGHDVPLGRYTTVRRLLPQRRRRMVGAWCFVDHFGPDDVTGRRPGMQVPPHPHTGLQTVSWLIQGTILHRDSLGYRQLIEPGQLNLMTAGHGISHSEESPSERPPVMHGLQLWLALPDSARHTPPRFEHHPVVPQWQEDGVTGSVVIGAFAGLRSPAIVHTPVVAVQAAFTSGARFRLPLERDFEYAVLVTTGAVEVNGELIERGSLLYLGHGHREVTLHGIDGGHLFLLGGEPFDEPLVMWWNFVGRSHAEIVEAREDWMAGRRFGSVTGYAGDALPAPTMPTTRLKARDRHGRTYD